MTAMDLYCSEQIGKLEKKHREEMERERAYREERIKAEREKRQKVIKRIRFELDILPSYMIDGERIIKESDYIAVIDKYMKEDIK